MKEFFENAGKFLAGLDWFRVGFDLVVLAVAIFLSIWVPARFLEYHTNQRGIRYVWYVVSSLILVMVYLCMYGYGHFWDNYAAMDRR